LRGVVNIPRGKVKKGSRGRKGEEWLRKGYGNTGKRRQRGTV